MRKPAPLRRHPVEARGFDGGRPKRFDIPLAEVVGIDENNVGRFGFCLLFGRF